MCVSYVVNRASGSVDDFNLLFFFGKDEGEVDWVESWEQLQAENVAWAFNKLGFFGWSYVHKPVVDGIAWTTEQLSISHFHQACD